MLDTTRLTVSIQIVSHVLAYTNLCIANPILYNCFSENFRKSFLKVSIYKISSQSIEISLTLSHYNAVVKLREWEVKINLILIASTLVNSNGVCLLHFAFLVLKNSDPREKHFPSTFYLYEYISQLSTRKLFSLFTKLKLISSSFLKFLFLLRGVFLWNLPRC